MLSDLQIIFLSLIKNDLIYKDLIIEVPRQSESEACHFNFCIKSKKYDYVYVIVKEEKIFRLNQKNKFLC